MSRGYQQALIVGNLGGDPETRVIASGSSVASFSVAVTESWKDGSETREHTEWFRIAAWGRLAELTSEYLRKGSRVLVIGSLRTRAYKDKDGNDRKATDLVAQRIQFLDGRREGEGRPREGGGGKPATSRYGDAGGDKRPAEPDPPARDSWDDGPPPSDDGDPGF